MGFFSLLELTVACFFRSAHLDMIRTARGLIGGCTITLPLFGDVKVRVVLDNVIAN